MRMILIVFGLVLAGWGVWDMYSGASYYGDRFGAPHRYTAKSMGPLFYFISGMKIFAGAYAIRLGLV